MVKDMMRIPYNNDGAHKEIWLFLWHITFSNNI